VSLAMTGVGHHYGDGPAVLSGIDLEVGAGETVAIVGPSGSGKTTLLSILGGLLRPSEGSVSLDGEPVGTRPLPPGAVSWIFQTINLLGKRSALANVVVGQLAIGKPHPEAISAAIPMLRAVGLDGMENQLAMQLSGGQAQRAGIARALVGNPRYVLADEPTGQLDRTTSAMTAEILFGARPPATSIITATHDPIIFERCQRRLALVDGRLQDMQ